MPHIVFEMFNVVVMNVAIQAALVFLRLFTMDRHHGDSRRRCVAHSAPSPSVHVALGACDEVHRFINTKKTS